MKNEINIKETYNLFMHSTRVGTLVEFLARRLGLDEEDCKEVFILGILHELDPSAIEKNTLKNHLAFLGGDYSASDFILKAICRYHNESSSSNKEKWVCVQMLEICDSFDTLMSSSIHNLGASVDDIIEIMKMESEKYNLEMLEEFFEIIKNGDCKFNFNEKNKILERV